MRIIDVPVNPMELLMCNGICGDISTTALEMIAEIVILQHL